MKFSGYFSEFFLTQFDDDENLEKTGILEVDLSELSIAQPSEGKVLPGEPSIRHTGINMQR